MSTLRVRAIQPILYKDRIYQPGEDWEAELDLVQGLLDMNGQLEEAKEPSLLVVPEVGLYLPNNAAPAAPSEEPASTEPAPPVKSGKGFS